MRKLIAALAAALGLMAAPIARADPPTITPAPALDFVDETCGFPVSVHFTVNGETAKTFSNGSTIVTGPLTAALSANGKTVTLNVSGPAFISPDGILIGRGVSVGPLSTPAGVTLAYTAGTVVVTDEGATLEHGRLLLDLCEALA
jgi:hypothetical protein